MRDGFVRCSYWSGQRFGKEAIQPKNRVRDVDGSTMTATLDAASVTFSAEVLRVNLASVWQDFDDYCRGEGGSDEVERAGGSDGVDLYTLFEKCL